MTRTEDLNSAIALLEYGSIADGIEAGDAMVKRAPLAVINAGTTHPGKYLVLVGGAVADVEEAIDSTATSGDTPPVDQLFLPDPHPALVAGLTGASAGPMGESLGIIETHSVAASVRAADSGLKGAEVVLRELYLGDGLGGKGYLLFSGPLVEVEAAVEAGAATAGDGLLSARVIAQLHDEMAENIGGDGRFRSRMRGS